MDLSAIFQRALRAGEFGPLQDELSYVEAYLSLEKARMGERLEVICCGQRFQDDHLYHAESPLLEQPVPTLTIQPLVENAVIHGISKKPAGGTVTIDFQEENGDLQVTVQDDGNGIPPERLAQILALVDESQPVSGASADLISVDGPKSGHVSLGLRNIDSRLRALYGDAYRLRITSQPGEGTRVVVRVPMNSE